MKPNYSTPGQSLMTLLCAPIIYLSCSKRNVREEMIRLSHCLGDPRGCKAATKLVQALEPECRFFGIPTKLAGYTSSDDLYVAAKVAEKRWLKTLRHANASIACEMKRLKDGIVGEAVGDDALELRILECAFSQSADEYQGQVRILRQAVINSVA